MKLSWFLVILLLLFVAVFSVQNAAPITVRFLPWEITLSAALVIQLAAMLGGIVGLIVGAMSRRRPKELAARPDTTEAPRSGANSSSTLEVLPPEPASDDFFSRPGQR